MNARACSHFTVFVRLEGARRGSRFSPAARTEWRDVRQAGALAATWKAPAAGPARHHCRVTTVEEFFGNNSLGLAIFERPRSLLKEPIEVRVTKSQVTFWRRRGLAYLWKPGRYRRAPTAEVVLSIALGRHDPSPHFKEVSHPTPRH